MKRRDKILEALKNSKTGDGMTTQQLSELLEISRANVSNELNKLVQAGEVRKINTNRPVIYQFIGGKTANMLDEFLKSNPSLYTAGEQVKAAVLYPPRGMNILITGATGTGKSMLAGMVHKYAVDMNVLDEASPFIVFNCADYANNPQLLLGHLFGIRKGSFTGANEDRTGLIEEAHNGILFLDEVHRLPSEGQEMFFTFLDKGLYRRLGETGSYRSAQVLLICATTESPQSALLDTFTRRIPMLIRLPDLEQRTKEERFGLIRTFFMEEAKRLNKQIHVSENSLRAFISYRCDHNVGQLKADIQLACAKAYAQFISLGKARLTVRSTDLPENVRMGLYNEVDHREFWNKIIGSGNGFYTFDSDANQIYLNAAPAAGNIYDYIDIKRKELIFSGLEPGEIDNRINLYIEDYFNKEYYDNGNKINLANLENLVDEQAIECGIELIHYAEERLQGLFTRKTYYAIIIHLDASIKRIQTGRRTVHPNENEIRRSYPDEYETAVRCLDMLREKFGLNMPGEEAGFLTMFFVLDRQKNVIKVHVPVRVFVLAHGKSTATSMAETVNTLLGGETAVGVNALLEKKPEEILEQLKKMIREIDCSSGILLLVDLGSLTNFGAEIEKELQIQTKTIPLVSTMHVLEAARKAEMGRGLEEIYRETLDVHTYMQSFIEESEKTAVSNKAKIVTICSTGEGTAKLLTKFLQDHLTYDSHHFELIPLQFISEPLIKAELDKLDNLLCIVSVFDFKYHTPVYSIERVLDKSILPEIQNLIDMELTYVQIEDSLSNYLYKVQSHKIVKEVKLFIHKLEKQLNFVFTKGEKIGLVFHFSCLIERLLDHKTVPRMNADKNYKELIPRIYAIIKKEIVFFEKEYSVSIPDDEVDYIITVANANEIL